MSITVSDCLKLPSLRDARVAAGSRGLSRIVSHVSVLEFANVNLLYNPRLFQANEIILTSFASIRDDVDTQCQVLDALTASGDVGIILYYVGYVVSELDPLLLEKADELDLPIIVMPEGRLDLGYHEVIDEIMDAVFRDRSRNPRFVNDMLERIAQLPEHLRTVDSVMQMLSEHLKSSVILTDATNRCLCFSVRPLTSPLTPETVLSCFADREAGEIHFTAELDGPVCLHRIPLRKPHLSLNLIIADEFGEVTPEDVSSAAELIPLFASIWNYDLDSMNIDAMIPSILEGNLTRACSIAEMERIPLDSVDQVLFIRPYLKEGDLHGRHEQIEQLTETVRNTLRSFSQLPLASTYYGLTAALLRSGKDAEEDEELLSQLEAELSAQGVSFSIARFTQLTSLEEIQESFLLFTDAGDDARAIWPLRRRCSAFDLQFAKECRNQLKGNGMEHRAGSDLLGALRGCEDGDALISTLAAYCLDAENDVKKTGELLFLHPNTVRYRLGKIRQRLSCDLLRMPESFLICRALAIHRLTQQ